MYDPKRQGAKWKKKQAPTQSQFVPIMLKRPNNQKSNAPKQKKHYYLITIIIMVIFMGK